MLLSANMIRAYSTFGMKETFDVFANVGFEGMDFNNDVAEYCSDAHTLPYYGKVNWEEVMQALAEIGYMGDLNYEASNFLKDLPKDLYIDGLTYMAKVGHYLISRFEYYRGIGK